ncbi:MAG: ABC transporter substrate-binding protein [Rhodocyclaceae bacterium]|nr:ABC transporter substrate-binding protein [Rhodocyclaceae bacterium]
MRIGNLGALACALAASLTLATAVSAAPTAPDELVKSTSEEVLAVIKQTTDRQKLLQLAQEKVVPHFDFQRMTQLAVGKSWRQATPEQQQQLEKEFQELLVRTYTNALAAGAHSNAKIQYKPMQGGAKGGDTVVKTQVIEPGKSAIAIDYYMENKADEWKVYDVTVDGVSLVTNYRESFATTVSNSGIDGLIKSLAAKNKGQPK